MRKIISLIALMSLFVAVPVFAQGGTTTSGVAASSTGATASRSHQSFASPTVVDVIHNNLVNFSTMIDKSGLASTLQSGQYTVFAPTDGSFETLLSNLNISLDALYANQPLMQAIVKYSTIPGTVMSTDLKSGGPSMATLLGPQLNFGFASDISRVTINNGMATIADADLTATNGVVHIVDNVLLPPNYAALLNQPATSSQANLPLTALDFVQDNFVTFTAVVRASGLQDKLDSSNITVLAPTDGAFRTFLTEHGMSEADLLANQSLLRDIVEYHIIPQQYTSSQLRSTQGLRSSNNETLSFGYDSSISRVLVDNGRASIAQPDIYVHNGIVDIIDNVLVPPDAVLPNAQ